MIKENQLWWNACHGNRWDVAGMIAEGLAKKAPQNHLNVNIFTSLWEGVYWIVVEEVPPCVNVKGIAPSR